MSLYHQIGFGCFKSSPSSKKTYFGPISTTGAYADYLNTVPFDNAVLNQNINDNDNSGNISQRTIIIVRDSAGTQYDFPADTGLSNADLKNILIDVYADFADNSMQLIFGVVKDNNYIELGSLINGQGDNMIHIGQMRVTTNSTSNRTLFSIRVGQNIPNMINIVSGHLEMKTYSNPTWVDATEVSCIPNYSLLGNKIKFNSDAITTNESSISRLEVRVDEMARGNRSHFVCR